MGKSKKKAARLCATCGYRHPTPTGKNCVMERRDLPDNSGVRFVEDEPPSDTAQEGAAAIHDAQVREAEFRDEFNARLDRLENLFMKSLEKDNSSAPAKLDKKSVISHDSELDSDDSVYSADTDDRRRRRKMKKAKSRFDQQHFVPDGEQILSFEMLMLVTANTMVYMLEHDLELDSIVHHLKFLATKATAARYKAEAFVNYDATVRHRVSRDGIQAFAEVSQEEVVLQFCQEHMLPKGKPVKKTELKKKTTNYCRQYNDAECHYQNCIFSHRCLACDEMGHGRRLCPSVKKSK